MYDLGSHFEIDLEKAKANPESIIQGKKYRFTLITDNLIRLEYSETSEFVDLPTMNVLYRNFPKVEFSIREDNNYIEITTKAFKLNYAKEKKFDGGGFAQKNLNVQVLNSDRNWYFGHPEARNVGTVDSGMDDKKIGNAKKLSDVNFSKGLFSFDGFVTLNDDSMIINNGVFEERGKSIDLYLFIYGNDFATCLNDYYKITGYPSLIPRAALGNWWFKNDDYNDTTLNDLLDNFRNNRIPLSILMLNNSWHIMPLYKNKYLTSGFTFNNDRFAKPSELVKSLHEQGIKLVLPINPFDGFHNVETYYDKACEYLEKDSNGVIPFNVLDPKCVDVYLKLFIHPLDNLEVDGYLIDYANRKNHNLDYLKHYEYKDMERNYKARPFVVASQSEYANHRYGIIKPEITTVGWEALKKMALYNVLSINKGNIWYSHDIGGYTSGIEDNELYTRFVELGVFSPILRLSSDKGKYYKREPWRWSIKTNTIVKEFLTLRHKMVPYLYSEAYKLSTQGKPFIKPLYYEDERLYDDEVYYNEYYLGSELLIAPITSKKDMVMNRTIKRIHMPEGIWYDFFSGKKFPGGKDYVSFYREQDYPVFAHSGSIIPLGLNPNINDTNPPKDMEIHIFPGKSNTYHMYEDDGISSLYKKDFYLYTDIDYNYLPNNYTVIIRAVEGKSGIVPAQRNYKIIFRNTKTAEDVKVFANDIQMEYSSYQNGPDFIVEIKNAKTTGQITVNCKGKDIEIDALRIINNDIETILSDLQIKTELKEKIDAILFDKELTVSKKRIAIRKLKNSGLEIQFIKLFLKLLEYINQV